MTKKKSSPQNRVWEKERRDRLNQGFDSLAKLLPDYEPATQLSKIEILQRAIEYVESLQAKIKASLEERDALLRKHVDELEERLKALMARNEDLAELLKQSNVQPATTKKIGRATIKREPLSEKNGSPKAVRLKKLKIKNKKFPVEADKPFDEPGKTETNLTIMQTKESAGESVIVGDHKIVKSSGPGENMRPVEASIACGQVPTAGAVLATTMPGGCIVLTSNQQLVGGLRQASGVNVTPALLPTPIMATGVLISNNGSVIPMPFVPPSSSLLIVSNEDVRSKLNMKKPRSSSSSPGNSAGKRTNGQNRRGRPPKKLASRFGFKTIEVIPGRIVNGKIPIPKLKQSDDTRSKKPGRKRRTKRKIEVNEEGAKSDCVGSEPKKMRKDGNGSILSESLSDKNGKSEEKENIPKESVNINRVSPSIEEQANSLDMNLDQGDLSEDIFANLQVPDTVTDDNQGSLSPTAAYLMNFPLVATGGKASGVHVDAPGEVEPIQVAEAEKKTCPQPAGENSLLLDNLTSYFNSNVYGGFEGAIQSVPEIVVSSTASTQQPSYTTIYQSIDSMLEHKAPVRSSCAADCRFETTPFTFTLTSTTATTTTQSSYNFRHSSSSNYFGSVTGVSKTMDDFNLPKLPIVSEFTFSLTSTTASPPKTVQSQYTNSIILSSTITTPSYTNYGYHSKNNVKANPASTLLKESIPKERKTPIKYDYLEAEKPATSFTFSLTSTTKTAPKYTGSSTSVALCSNVTQTNNTSIYSIAEDCLYRNPKTFPNNHQPYKTPTKQKFCPYTSTSTGTISSQAQTQSSQSRYDINWMTSQDHKTTTAACSSDYSQMLQPIDYNANTTYQTNFDLSRSKSDIFFAHPTADDNLPTWSPNKLSNILNDTASSYYPSTAATLPNLHGDLALNTYSKQPVSNRKANESGTNFLSVQQLVDQPRKNKTFPSSSNNNIHQYGSNLKPPNSSYSAEALIGGPTSNNNSNKKDRYYPDTTYSTYNNLPPTETSALQFNFDYSSNDYSKNFSYGCQQNYMAPLMDNNYNLAPNLSSVTTSTTTTSSYTGCYGSYPTDKKHSNNYYSLPAANPSAFDTNPPLDIPYYVPSSEKRLTNSLVTPTLPDTTKPKKTIKHSSTFNEYYEGPCYNNYPLTSNPAKTISSTSLNTAASTSYYSHQQQYPQQQHLSSTGGSSSSVTNFNVSSICPEINDKVAATATSNRVGESSSSDSSRRIGTGLVSTTTHGRHAITGGTGWC
ncbi:mucin-2-like [Uranotaenia lowii]|uniref:mucin-2-like n=1 Tax=Uranotaenia lowii TaxID=190385 RepID=UPI00247AF241|nr:mucin-2-like [Uranotaenia lowii]